MNYLHCAAPPALAAEMGLKLARQECQLVYNFDAVIYDNIENFVHKISLTNLCQNSRRMTRRKIIDPDKLNPSPFPSLRNVVRRINKDIGISGLPQAEPFFLGSHPECRDNRVPEDLPPDSCFVFGAKSFAGDMIEEMKKKQEINPHFGEEDRPCYRLELSIGF